MQNSMKLTKIYKKVTNQKSRAWRAWFAEFLVTNETGKLFIDSSSGMGAIFAGDNFFLLFKILNPKTLDNCKGSITWML